MVPALVSWKFTTAADRSAPFQRVFFLQEWRRRMAHLLLPNRPDGGIIRVHQSANCQAIGYYKSAIWNVTSLEPGSIKSSDIFAAHRKKS